jgi:hypothetical protein
MGTVPSKAKKGSLPSTTYSDDKFQEKKFPTYGLPVPYGSVADPGCLSRIPDPDFYPSRIPDPKTATKERGEKKKLS